MKSCIISIVVILYSIPTDAQKVDRVDGIGITVSDLDRSVEFYTKVLKFQKISEAEFFGTEYEQLKGVFGIRFKKALLRLGEEQIELTDFLTAGGRSIPEDSRSNDLWFQHIAIVVSNMDSAYATLRSYNVTHVSTGPQTLPKSIPEAEGISAFYFKDPDGHTLELINFPRGKGNPKWQTQTNLLFLGIDHTAIGISRTSGSKIFYGELLGVKFQGESFNAGVEQQHLNNVSGARLHITGNKTAHGPGVEFLEYLEPNDGRPYPQNEKSDDLIHWETIFTTSTLDELYKKLLEAKVKFISPSVINIADKKYLYRRGFYVRDPDGHVVGVFEKR
jgi:catechol 2,3-dioxygenase-like lactoylglutathione lyase family enzyme